MIPRLSKWHRSWINWKKTLLYLFKLCCLGGRQNFSLVSIFFNWTYSSDHNFLGYPRFFTQTAGTFFVTLLKQWFNWISVLTDFSNSPSILQHTYAINLLFECFLPVNELFKMVLKLNSIWERKWKIYFFFHSALKMILIFFQNSKMIFFCYFIMVNPGL